MKRKTYFGKETVQSRGKSHCVLYEQDMIQAN